MQRPTRRRPHAHTLTELEQLQAIDKAFSQPERLIDVMRQAADPEEAVSGIGREFDLREDLAWMVTDQQLMAFTGQRLSGLRSRIAALMPGSGEAEDVSPPPPAPEVVAWVDIALYGLEPGNSQIGWSGPEGAAAHVPFLDAAIRELTHLRNRMVDQACI